MRPRLVLAHRSRPPLPRSLWGAHQPRCLLPFLDVPPFIHLADASLPATQLILSSCISGVFLLSNFHAHLADCFPYGEGDAKKKTYLILGTMTGFHVGLLLLFKAYFFSYK